MKSRYNENINVEDAKTEKEIYDFLNQNVKKPFLDGNQLQILVARLSAGDFVK